MDWRDVPRGILLLGAPALIIWLGGEAIAHIGELYDGLCPVQGPGVTKLLYDDNRQGYCSGIGSDLYILGIITAVAVLATIASIALWAGKTKKESRRRVPD
jgi:hypothetical protein